MMVCNLWNILSPKQNSSKLLQVLQRLKSTTTHQSSSEMINNIGNKIWDYIWFPELRSSFSDILIWKTSSLFRDWGQIKLLEIKFLSPLTNHRRGGKCLFNSLAYNCDFKDAIGKIGFLTLILYITPNLFRGFIWIISVYRYFSVHYISFFIGAVNEASYWGSSSPGK